VDVLRPLVASAGHVDGSGNFTDRGYHGFSVPDADLFLQNLFEPRWGLFAFWPILLFAFLGAGGRPRTPS